MCGAAADGPTKVSSDNKALTIKKPSALLKVGEATLCSAASKWDLPACKANREWRFLIAGSLTPTFPFSISPAWPARASKAGSNGSEILFPTAGGKNEIMEVELTIPTQSQLAETIFRESGQNVNLCCQCRKCAAGCPVSYAMDYSPTQLLHAIRLGMDDLVFQSRTMWLCASCETCTTRCPQEVDIAGVMDAVKIIALRQGVKPAIPRVAAFYKAALASIRNCGRMFELGMILDLKLRTREFFKDAELGMKMLRKGKLRILPSFAGAWTTRKIFRRVRKLESKNRAA